jgi:hypothetical protein
LRLFFIDTTIVTPVLTQNKASFLSENPWVWRIPKVGNLAQGLNNIAPRETSTAFTCDVWAQNDEIGLSE